ncbi:hypothetical protein BDV19DRAFT_236142 [Aspergillus venezuelensis]
MSDHQSRRLAHVTVPSSTLPKPRALIPRDHARGLRQMRADFVSRCDAPWALFRQKSPLPVRNPLFRWLTCPCKAAEPSHTSFISTSPLGRRFLPPTYSSRLRPRLSASLFWSLFVSSCPTLSLCLAIRFHLVEVSTFVIRLFVILSLWLRFPGLEDYLALLVGLA